jgi:hypothetical protein
MRSDMEIDGVTGRPQDLAVKVAVPQSDGVFNRSQACPAPSIIEGTTMEYYEPRRVCRKL